MNKIDYVELDPMIITMAGKYLPPAYYNALKDPRVSIKNTDNVKSIIDSKDKRKQEIMDEEKETIIDQETGEVME